MEGAYLEEYFKTVNREQGNREPGTGSLFLIFGMQYQCFKSINRE